MTEQPKLKNRLTEFRQSIRTQGLLKESKYLVVLTPPYTLRGNPLTAQNVLDGIGLFARNAPLPGKQLATSETNFGGARAHAYRSLYTPFDMNFYLSRDLREKQFFDEWQKSAIDPVTYVANSYYKEYVSTLTVYTVSDMADIGDMAVSNIAGRLPGGTRINNVINHFAGIDMKVTSKTTFYDVYPVTVSDTAMSADATDTLATMAVNFFYRTYKTEYYMSPNKLERAFEIVTDLPF